MITRRPIYVSYTEGGEPPFALFDDHALYEGMIAKGKGEGRVVSLLQARSPLSDDSPIEIACVTEEKVSQERADSIRYQAVVWLMETGIMVRRGHE